MEDVAEQLEYALEEQDENFTTFEVRMSLQAEYGDHPEEEILNTAMDYLSRADLLRRATEERRGKENHEWIKTDNYRPEEIGEELLEAYNQFTGGYS